MATHEKDKFKKYKCSKFALFSEDKQDSEENISLVLADLKKSSKRIFKYNELKKDRE